MLPTYLPTYLPTEWTISMEHSPSWEANNRSSGQEILRLVWNSNFHHRVHKSQPLVPILSQISPSQYNYPIYASFFRVLFAFQSLGLKFCKHFSYFSFVLHALPILSSLIFGEAYKLWSFSLGSLLHPPATFSISCQHILLSTLMSNNLNLCSSLIKRPSFQPIQTNR